MTSKRQKTQKGQKETRKTDQKSIVNIPGRRYNGRQEGTTAEAPIKDFKELDLTDNFMFLAVMKDMELCKPLLEMILDVSLEEQILSGRDRCKPAGKGRGI